MLILAFSFVALPPFAFAFTFTFALTLLAAKDPALHGKGLVSRNEVGIVMPDRAGEAKIHNFLGTFCLLRPHRREDVTLVLGLYIITQNPLHLQVK